MSQFVEDTPDVVFYKDCTGKARRVAVEEDNHFSDSGVDMTEPK